MTPNSLTRPLLCVPNRIKQLNNRIVSPSCCFGALNDSDESLPLSLEKGPEPVEQSNFLNNIQEQSRGGSKERWDRSEGKRKDKNTFTLFIIYDPQKMAKKFISDSLNSL